MKQHEHHSRKKKISSPRIIKEEEYVAMRGEQLASGSSLSSVRCLLRAGLLCACTLGKRKWDTPLHWFTGFSLLSSSCYRYKVSRSVLDSLCAVWCVCKCARAHRRRCFEK